MAIKYMQIGSLEVTPRFCNLRHVGNTVGNALLVLATFENLSNALGANTAQVA